MTSALQSPFISDTTVQEKKRSSGISPMPSLPSSLLGLDVHHDGEALLDLLVVLEHFPPQHRLLSG